MWPFKSYKKEFQKTQRRDALLVQLGEAAEKGVFSAMADPLFRLMTEFTNDPLLRPVIIQSIDTLAKKDLNGALLAALYIFGSSGNPQLQLAVAEKCFALMPQLDRQSAKEMAQMAMLTGAMTGIKPGSATENDALLLWDEAMDRLAELDVKNFALAAACNAAISLGSRALSDAAFKKWEAITSKLAKTDRALAEKLVTAFLEKNEEIMGSRIRLFIKDARSGA